MSVGFIDYKGIKILQVSFPDGSDTEKIREVIMVSKAIISKQPEQSLLTLTNLGVFTYNTEIAKMMEEYVTHNKPYVKAGAIIGVSGLKKAIYNSLMIISRRNVKICEKEEDAKEYLYECAKGKADTSN